MGQAAEDELLVLVQVAEGEPLSQAAQDEPLGWAVEDEPLDQATWVQWLDSWRIALL
jgi:hypothetical protein